MKTIKQNLKSLTKSQFLLLKDYTKNSNALYNSSLYICNKYFEETGKYIGYNKLYNIIKTNIHYKNMTSFNAQAILKLVDQNYRSYFALLRKKQSGHYSDSVHTPKYRKPKSEFILVFNSQRVKLKNNILKLTKDIKIKFTYDIPGQIVQAIVKPNNFGSYTLLLTYKENNVVIPETDTKNFLSIDLGLDNLATCVSNVGPSFIVNGKPLKSYNNYYNKNKSKIQSELKVKNDMYYSTRLANLNLKRGRFIDNYMSQSVAIIAKYCISKKIGKVVLGYNESWKQNINLGKATNQHFVNVPYYNFKQKLRSKLESLQIELVEVNESYTSKCSSIDNELVENHNTYLGKRVSRGLFRSAEGILLNADVNGAINIARKVISEININEIWVFIVTPQVLNVFNLENSFHILYENK